ncbi:hypothetical protein WKW79_22815 [Variovorax robiniae]|uniref:Uncharacterized protein n=1 Tax=Variovorax robiniae TaxID=1836199 RepID=A0ABU8XEE8_9BURK
MKPVTMAARLAGPRRTRLIASPGDLAPIESSPRPAPLGSDAFG